MPTVEILSQGDEIITGHTVDTNTAWLAKELSALGLHVRFHTSIGDNPEHIKSAFKLALSRVDICISTGGLGPTTDDLTAEAAAAAIARPLVLDETAWAHIQALFKKYKVNLAPSNIKQAYLPETAIRLDNHWGTAPGFRIHTKTASLTCFPGVPHEMKKMFII